jgi:uncharacterized protein (DUF2147 family)
VGFITMNSVRTIIESLSAKIIAACLLSSLLAHANGLSPVGRWKTFDENTGEPKAIIRIQQQGGALYGWIEKILGEPKDARPTRCTECEGKLKNAPIIGLKIIQDMQREDDDWHGHIIDPESGDIYNATMSPIEAGRKLKLRGYIGIPLLGRTRVWKRVP